MVGGGGGVVLTTQAHLVSVRTMSKIPDIHCVRWVVDSKMTINFLLNDCGVPNYVNFYFTYTVYISSDCDDFASKIYVIL
jgi:hypothetical protein